MPHYVALLRGIGPGNPNMRNDKLRGVFEDLGFTNVKSVISSGNVLFEAPNTDTPALEATIEAALAAKLGLTSKAIIRSHAELRQLFDQQPFAGYEHTPKTYLTVTFLQRPPQSPPKPEALEGRGSRVVDIHDRTVYAIVDTTAAKTPDFMVRLEKQFGKAITTRTWKTVERILKAFP